MSKKKDFTHSFEIIWEVFSGKQAAAGKAPQLAQLSGLLGHSNHTKVKAWRKGQWPHAEDIALLHERLGLDLRWLVTGEGQPLGGVDAEKEAMRKRLAALEAELQTKDRVISQLTTKLLVDGTGDQGGATDTGKVADGPR